jgi:aryl-alcohol dehydrogenase-like predicted oxidoreductase
MTNRVAAMQKIRLGRNGPMVSAFGLGCMGMSGGYGPTDEKECIATIHAALEAGITMLDTGDFYGMGQNEMLIREALKGGKRERAFIAVKYGSMRGPDLRILGDDGRPRPRITSPIRCAGSAPTMSISINRPGSIPTCRSRIRSAPSPTW